MSAKSIASVGFLAGVIGLASVGYLDVTPVPPQPPVVFSMQGGGPGGGSKWYEEAHAKDLAIAKRKALAIQVAEDADEETILLAIIAEAVQTYYT